MVTELKTRLGVTVVGVSTIGSDNLEYGRKVIEEWGITGFPNIADDGEVYKLFRVLDNPTSVLISTDGEATNIDGRLTTDRALELMETTGVRDS